MLTVGHPLKLDDRGHLQGNTAPTERWPYTRDIDPQAGGLERSIQRNAVDRRRPRDSVRPSGGQTVSQERARFQIPLQRTRGDSVTNTANWPIKTLALSRLLPDPDNVRIQGVVTDEISTLKYLYDNEEVLDLAKDILRDGYVDLEPLLVYLHGAHYVVLEGNRRLSALKGISDPGKVAGWTARIHAEKERVDGFVPVSRVRVIVAPDRQSGLPAVARLHTRTSKKRWAREQQAKFYFDKLGDGVTVANLRAEYPAEATKISKFISMGDMAQRARAAAAASPDALEFLNSAGFKMTSFEYLYNSSVFQALSGVTFSPDGFATFSATTDEETKRLLLQIVLDLRSKLLSTRSVKVGSEEHRDYVKSLMDIARGKKSLHSDVLANDDDDDGRVRGTEYGAESGDGPTKEAEASDGEPTGGRNEDGTDEARADEETYEAGPEHGPGEGRDASATGSKPAVEGNRDDEDYEDVGAGSNGKRDRAPNAAAFDHRLNFDGVTLNLSSSGLRVRYDELRRIRVDAFPNATVDMIRTFLEVSLKVYFDEAGDPVTSPNGPVQLSHCLTHAALRLKANSDAMHVIGVLKSRQTSTNGQYLGSATALNNSNHEPGAIFSQGNVNTMWGQLKPLIVFLLNGRVAS